VEVEERMHASVHCVLVQEEGTDREGRVEVIWRGTENDKVGQCEEKFGLVVYMREGISYLREMQRQEIGRLLCTHNKW
jgi:hypothetical protein